MLTFEREVHLEDPIARHLKGRHFRLLSKEAPFYDYRIDMFALSTAQNRCVAVELKLTKWRRAFEQALVYQLCADFAFVAMPKNAASRVPVDLFRTHGVGLIAVDRRCTILIPALQSTVVCQSYRSGLIQFLREHS